MSDSDPDIDSTVEIETRFCTVGSIGACWAPGGAHVCAFLETDFDLPEPEYLT